MNDDDIPDRATAQSPRRWLIPYRDWTPKDHVAEACVLLDTPQGMAAEDVTERIQRSIAHSWIAQNKMIGGSR